MENPDFSHEMKPWTIVADATLARFDTTLKGLTDAEARQRLERHSRNRLREKPPRPAWMKFLVQFKDLLVIVLLGAAVLAGAIGDIKDAVVILIVVVFNTFVLFPCIGGRHRESSTPWT
ncbi:MAG TPA: cation-transporting P-type ATPase [Thiobacillus sp.]|nr:cation-transporting P-type ATPase [Thiobacillus sp.]